MKRTVTVVSKSKEDPAKLLLALSHALRLIPADALMLCTPGHQLGRVNRTLATGRRRAA